MPGLGLVLVLASVGFVVAGGFGLWWAARLYRRNARAAGLGLGCGAALILLIGLGVVAQVLLLVLYTLSHDPPRGEIVEDVAPPAALPAP